MKKLNALAAFVCSFVIVLIGLCLTSCGGDDDNKEPDPITTQTYHVSDSEAFANAASAGGNIILEDDITLTQTILITKQTSIGLNGHKIKAYSTDFEGDSIIEICGAKVDVMGDGGITTTVNVIFNLVSVNGNGSTLTISGGTFVSYPTLAKLDSTSKFVIKDGEFTMRSSGSDMAKMIDNTENGEVEIYGGTFEKFDPTSFVVEGHGVSFDEESNKYIVA